jgi:hypothetical protein
VVLRLGRSKQRLPWRFHGAFFIISKRKAIQFVTVQFMPMALRMICVVVALACTHLAAGQDDLVYFEQNGLYGYLNSRGNVVIEPKFPFAAARFSEGVANVSICTDGGFLWGFIDKSGKFAIPPSFEDAKPFREGMAGIKVHGKWGFINAKGETIVEPQFADQWTVDWEFSEGLAVVKIDEKYGYIDKSGKIVIPAKFDFAKSFYEGMAAVEIGEKGGFIDRSGAIVVSPRYQYADRFSEGLGIVNIGRTWNYNSDDPRYSAGKWYYIDAAGRIAFPTAYEYADDFSEGLANVKLNGKSGFIDKEGRFRIEPRFERAEMFSVGLAAVELNDRWGYIDKTGRFVIKPRFLGADNFKGGISAVKTVDPDYLRIEYINAKGKTFWTQKTKLGVNLFLPTCPPEKNKPRISNPNAKKPVHF